MIILNTFYNIEVNNSRITFNKNGDNTITGIYNDGTVNGTLEGNTLKATFHNEVENMDGLMEITFHQNGFDAKWKTGLESGPMRGKWKGVLSEIVLTEDNEEEFLDTKEIKIGAQIWSKNNLAVTTFKNGDQIEIITDNKKWAKSKKPAMCYYENNTENGKTYGAMYNLFAVLDSRGLAPEGFKIPSEDDFRNLIDTLGSQSADKLKSKENWENGKNGTSQLNFNAFPGGFRQEDGEYWSIGNGMFFWSSTKDANDGWYLGIDNDIEAYLSCQRPNCGLYIRCIKS
jgi:uncharacterized protein (TIGR02145 family)